MATPDDKPKLSLLATFDDQTRMLQSLFDNMDDNFNGPIGMFQDYEENRKRWLLTSRDVKDRDHLIAELKKENQTMKIRLETIRLAYTREVKEKDQLQKKYAELRKKLVMVQEVLNEERSGNTRSNSVLSVLSELSKLPSPTKPAKSNDHNESDDGLLFDKSEDTLEDLDTSYPRAGNKIRTLEPTKFDLEKQPPSVSSKPPPEAPIYLSSKSTANLNQVNHLENITEEEEQESLLNVGFISAGKIDMQHDDDDKVLSSTPVSSVKSIAAMQPESKVANSPSMPSNRRKSGKLMTLLNKMRSSTKLEINRLDSRPHNFMDKKVFKGTTCVACGKSINFCTNCLVCVDCRGLVHQRCQAKLPKPCIPYVASKSGLKKMTSSASVVSSHMAFICDFTSPQSRPCVPALLVHCCKEIEEQVDLALKNPKVASRGAEKASPVYGIYQESANDREIRDLRTAILEAKNGIPNLAEVKNVHVIAGVVCSFLFDLDDPLVTRILWNDFVRAADHIDEYALKDETLIDSDYQSESPLDSTNSQWQQLLNVLKGVVIQLPNANRDSMAYLFLHFRRLIQAEGVTKFDVTALARTFGHIIVGTATQRTTSFRMSFNSKGTLKKVPMINTPDHNIGLKQQSVMRALYRLAPSFWEGLLKDPDYCPFDDEFIAEVPTRKSLNQSMLQHLIQPRTDATGNHDPLY